MRYFILVSFIFLINCSNEQTINSVKDLRNGSFKSEIVDGDVTSFFTRKDSIQIEKFEDEEYRYSVKWKSDFEYELLNLAPKNPLDNTPFIIKITGVHKEYYTFTAYYKGSKFKQKGKTYKLK